jgi:hypothetical protein
MGVLAAAFVAASVLSIAGRTPLSLPADDGGVVRSAALGVLLVVAGMLSIREQRGAPR